MSGRFPPRIFRRVPFEAELRLRYEPGDDEIVARTANVSLGGTFVVTAEPRPPGTTLELSFKLPEQPAPVRGRGRVIWVRERDEGPGRPAGMGVRFLELTPGSREQIFEVVERRVRDGGSPYDTGSEDSGSIADRRDDTGPLPAVAAAGAEGTLGAGAAEATAAGPAGPPAGESPAALRTDAPAEPTAPVGERPSREPGAAAAEPAPSAPPAGETPSAEERPSREAAGERAVPPWSSPAGERAAPSWSSPAGEPAAPPPPPPVEMPEPEGRFAYSVGSAYASRVRRGVRGGWLIAAGAVVVIAAVAVAGYLVLAGEGTPRVADGARAGAPERERIAGPEVDAADAEPADLPEDAADPGEAAGTAPPPVEQGSEPATEPAEQPAPAAPLPADFLEAEPAAAPAESAGDAAEPARRITRITWQQRDGATELVIWGDGRFVPGSYRRSSLGGERPRELIRLAGIVEPYAAGSVEVGTPQVSRVRTGHHVETEPDELHVVVDLAGPGVAASELRADGDRLWLRLEGR